MTSHEHSAEPGDQNMHINPFEVPFDNFKTKRRRTFSGRGRYFANVKQFFNGCKNRVRSLKVKERYYILQEQTTESETYVVNAILTILI